MKIYFIFCLFSLLILASCSSDRKENSFLPQDNNANLRSTTNTFSDTSNWELMYLYHQLSNMKDADLLTFLNQYGQPNWDQSIQKRGTQTHIASIPMMQGDSITGIFKVYVSSDDSLAVKFFSLSVLDSAITYQLATEEYQLIRGAIQSLVIISHRLDYSLDSKYLNWLQLNNYRANERIAWYCLEWWDCMEIYTSGSTGWSFFNTSNWAQYWGGSSEEYCKLIDIECWLQWPTYNFPNSGSNYPGNGNNGNQNTGGAGNSGNENSAIKNAKTIFLNNWLTQHGLSSDYFDLLYGCVGYLASPLGGSTDEFIDIECVSEIIYDILNLPNIIVQELSQYQIGSDEWIEVINLQYPGENYKSAWYRLTNQEKLLCKEWSIPALIIFSNKSNAEYMTNIRYPNSNKHNDKADAFRHAYFNAINVRHIHPDIVQAFGDAHETETPIEFALEVQMDLFNNSIGKELGNWNHSKSDIEIADLIQVVSNQGGLKYLKPIIYNDPCYWPCPSNPIGTHGIISSTALVNTNQ